MLKNKVRKNVSCDSATVCYHNAPNIEETFSFINVFLNKTRTLLSILVLSKNVLDSEQMRVNIRTQARFTGPAVLRSSGPEVLRS